MNLNGYKLIKKILKKLVFLFKKIFIFEKHLIIDECKVVSDYFGSEIGTVVDIGAMKGGCTDLFFAKGWDCFAVECNPDLVEFLKVKYMKNKNVKIINKAISFKNSRQKLYKSNESLGITSLLDFHNSHEYFKDVSTITFSKFLNSEQIFNIDFLKIDIEGYEYFVLNDPSFKKIKPKIVLLEFEFNKIKKLNLSTNQILNKLIELDYIIYIFEWYPIKKFGTFHDFKKFYNYKGQNLDNDSWGNILAFSSIPNEYKLLKIVEDNIKNVYF